MHGAEDRVLVVEDEQEISSLLERYLTREGYVVTVAAGIGQAEKYLAENAPSLLILDLMLPDGDGLRFCRKVRSEFDIPIIILTAKDGQIDKIKGLETGADDYVTKPFDVNELVARVRAQLRRNRRPAETQAHQLAFAGLSIDRRNRTVAAAGRMVELSPVEFDLLALLAQNPGTVFTKERIIRGIYPPGTHIDDNTLNVHIRRLRKKIEPDPENPVFIITVWKIGFKVREADA
jgi:DNA-binding response OmpR family regulator